MKRGAPWCFLKACSFSRLLCLFVTCFLVQIHSGLGQTVKIRDGGTGEVYSGGFRILICEGSKVSLSVVSPKVGYVYSWKAGNTTVANGTSVDLYQAGMYTLEGSPAGNGTSEKVKFTIAKENLDINVVLTGAVSGNMLCSGRTITISVSGADMYDWYDGKGFVSDSKYTVSNSGVYSFKAKSVKGCIYLKSLDIKNALIPDLKANGSLCL